MAETLVPGQTDKCKWHEGQINKVAATIYGNGKEGMLARIARLETYTKVLIALDLSILGVLIGAIIKGLF